MKLLKSLLLHAFLGTAIAASDSANVYTFPASERDISTGPPSLSPDEARLIIAQRLGVSRYHDLHHATEDGIRYVNAFGGRQSSLFGESAQENERYHLVVMVEGITSKLEKAFVGLCAETEPAFKVSSPPSNIANSKLIEDMMAQSSKGIGRKDCGIYEAIDPFHEECWAGLSNFVHLDLELTERAADDFLAMALLVLRSAKDSVMDVMIVLLPESSHTARDVPEPYGSYEMPTKHSRRQAEEPITPEANPNPSSSNVKAQAPSTSPVKPIKTIIPRCHGSADSCNVATGNCSGHGLCKKKFGTDNQDACYACSCVASLNMTDGGYKQSTYWGGSACQKEDISAQFWLLAGSSVAAVGLISWGIGMLFSIGEEKLPGVIGAGVSGPKAR